MKAMIAALAMMLPVGAMAQTVTVKRGETVTVTIGDDGTVRQGDSQSIDPSNFEIADAAAAQRGDYDQAVGSNAIGMGAEGVGKLAPVPVAGRLVIRFIRTPGKDQSMLSIQNGYTGALSYRARIHVDGKDQATDVCIVLPGKLGIEHWPYAIDRLDLSEFKLAPWRAGDPVRCV